MKRANNKSRCPTNFTLEILGDSWSLLIIRDMAAIGSKTFGEFLESPERISPSVLADRLVHLVQCGIIAKQPNPDDKRKSLYTFTETGLDVLPILYEVAKFGTYASPNPQAPDAWFAAVQRDRDATLKAWREALLAGSSLAHGPDSVANKLGL